MESILYIGGYGSRSITRSLFRDGSITPLESYSVLNASYLCMDASWKHLYCVGETLEFNGHAGGSVHSFDIKPDGRLLETSSAATHGCDPCHITILSGILVASNYTSGSYSRFSLAADGRIDRELPLIEHFGSGKHPIRQKGPHIHQALLTPFGSYAVVDLGLDAICFYPLPEIADAAPRARVVHVPSGYGPRHCCFMGSDKPWYVLCELESVLLVYRGKPGEETLAARLPIGSGGQSNAPAALRISPDRKLLAASGRGENIISLFALTDSGLPAKLTEVSCRGVWPRDIQFSPDSRYLVCANERSNTVTVFEIENGKLNHLSETPVKTPTCLLFGREQ